MLTCDPETHIYRHDGHVVPGVTEIISPFIQWGGYKIDVNTAHGVPAEIMDEAAWKGQEIHRACMLEAQGRLDWDSLPEEYKGPVGEFRKWVEDCEIDDADWGHIEERFYSPKWAYAGTPDITVCLDGRWTVVDIKTGAEGFVGAQTAAYMELINENRPRAARITNRAVLILPKDGSPYTYKQLTNKRDWPAFLSKLNWFNYVKGGN